MHVQGHVRAVSTSRLLSAEQADKLVAKENMHTKNWLTSAFLRTFTTLVLALNIHYACSEAFKVQDK